MLSWEGRMKFRILNTSFSFLFLIQLNYSYADFINRRIRGYLTMETFVIEEIKKLPSYESILELMKNLDDIMPQIVQKMNDSKELFWGYEDVRDVILRSAIVSTILEGKMLEPVHYWLTIEEDSEGNITYAYLNAGLVAIDVSRSLDPSLKQLIRQRYRDLSPKEKIDWIKVKKNI